jgi:glycosyltransferase involved in cell wall biosynthesis
MPEPAAGLAASVPVLEEIVSRFSPDVLHLNQFFYGAFDWGVPAVVTAHSDVASWWRSVKGEPPPNDAWFRRYRSWVAAGLQGAAARSAPTRWLATEIERIYASPPVAAIHNGRTAGPWRAASLPERARLVVTAGRLWDEGKGARDLAAAAPHMPRGVRVVLAGATIHPGGGANLPAAIPPVEHAGPLPAAELRSLLGQAAVYAATSRYEPFGLAPLEAALAGCALVMSDIPSFRELWQDCALFYPPADAAALATCCGALLADADRRASVATAARVRALDLYTPPRMAAEYEALYRKIVTSDP